MKLYTRKGDGGMTSLASGRKVTKHDPGVALYGTADELNASLGLAAAFLEIEIAGLQTENKNHFELLKNQLVAQQGLLFELGAELSGYRPDPEKSAILESDIETLERWIDEHTIVLPELKSFILPGGTLASAQLHVSRTICRRLERDMSRLYFDKMPDDPDQLNYVQASALKYINRLSDYLFSAARHACHLSGHTDTPWQSRR